MGLKELLLIIRPENALASEEILLRHGADYVIRQTVSGRGKEMGQKLFRSWLMTNRKSSPYIRKAMLSALLDEKLIPRVLAKLLMKNQTGKIGDGRVFVLPCEGYAS